MQDVRGAYPSISGFPRFQDIHSMQGAVGWHSCRSHTTGICEVKKWIPMIPMSSIYFNINPLEMGFLFHHGVNLCAGMAPPFVPSGFDG